MFLYITLCVLLVVVQLCSPVYWHPRPWFNIKMSSDRYRKSHCGDKTVVGSSYLHNGISYTGKMSSSYWIGALNPTTVVQSVDTQGWGLYRCHCYCFCILLGDTSVGYFTITLTRSAKQGLYSLSGKPCYHQISRSLEAVNFGVIMIVSLSNWTGISTALLPRSLANSRAIEKVSTRIARLRDCTRSYGTTA